MNRELPSSLDGLIYLPIQIDILFSVLPSTASKKADDSHQKPLSVEPMHLLPNGLDYHKGAYWTIYLHPFLTFILLVFISKPEVGQSVPAFIVSGTMVNFI